MSKLPIRVSVGLQESTKNFILMPYTHKGFPGGAIGKESTCNAGDTRDVGSIPGCGRSPGVGNGNPL